MGSYHTIPVKRSEGIHVVSELHVFNLMSMAGQKKDAYLGSPHSTRQHPHSHQVSLNTSIYV